MRSSRSTRPDPLPVDPRHAWLTAQPYAHRGLHGKGVVENSRAVSYENDSRYAVPEPAIERAPADEARDILSGRGLY